MPKRSFIGTVISAAIFILMETAAFAMLRSSSELRDVWLNKLSYGVVGSIWKLEASVRGFSRLGKVNEQLAEENHRLRQENRKMKMICDALAAEDSLVSLPAPDFDIIPSRVVKMNRNTLHNFIIIDKGSEDGVRRGCGVITPKGVAGIVNAVDKHRAYAISFMNSQFAVSARIGRDGVCSILVWDGRRDDGAVLKDFPLHFLPSPGDTVYTSGYSAIFPSDIPLGVVETTGDQDGVTGYASVKLFENFSSLKYVTVTRNRYEEEMMKLEEEGGIDR